MRNSFKKWPLELWWISNKTLMKVGNITKAATFKSFLHLSYKTCNYFFCDSAFSFYMRKKVSDGFWGLHKNMNCAFPLTVDKLH